MATTSSKVEAADFKRVSPTLCKRSAYEFSTDGGPSATSKIPTKGEHVKNLNNLIQTINPIRTVLKPTHVTWETIEDGDYIRTTVRVHILDGTHVVTPSQGLIEGVGHARRKLPADIHRTASPANDDDAEDGAANMAAEDALKIIHSMHRDMEYSAMEELNDSARAATVRLGANEETRMKVLQSVEEVLQSCGVSVLRTARVHAYGTWESGPCLGESDLQVTISLRVEEEGFHTYTDADILRALEMGFLQHGNADIECDTKAARLRFWDEGTDSLVEVMVVNACYEGMLKFLRVHCRVDGRVWELWGLVRAWARSHGMMGGPNLRVPGVAWLVMVIFFLQKVVRPQVASVLDCSTLADGGLDIEGADVGAQTQRVEGERCNGKEVGELMMLFLKFYAYDFRYDGDRVSITALEVLPNCERAADVSHAVFVEHPMIEDWNLCRDVHVAALERARRMLSDAYDACVRFHDLSVVLVDAMDIGR